MSKVRLPRPFWVFLLAAIPLTAQDSEGPPLYDYPGPNGSEVLIPAGTASELPIVQANDNRVAAGQTRNGVREISLEVLRADWRIESGGGPGLRVAAVAESGGMPMIPAPLIRVNEGTRVRVTVRNTLASVLQVYGLHDHPAQDNSPTRIEAGATRVIEFSAGARGTYLYHMFEGEPIDPEIEGQFAEREQLAGALVVDPPGGPEMADRVMVINIFTEPTGDPLDSPYLEGLTINGQSWPYTERIQLEVGQTQRWKVVNASIRVHPMHLHGFYYQVLSRGTSQADTVYTPENVRHVVTELMSGRTTMEMEWTPSRPGRWLFHCHLSFHVTNELRLPGAVEVDPEHAHAHMSGLVIGLEIAPGPTDLIARGEPVELDLFARKFGEDVGFRYGFTRGEDDPREPETETPGPLLVFNQYQAADVTVHNRIGVPTGVHWHGLELDGWADGVPDWSSSAGRTSPAIQDGEDFTYRLSLMRPGTFMYHSHMDDLDQLTGGLFGALIVLPEGETWDPAYDHIKVFGWRTATPGGPDDVELNGGRDGPDASAVVGETHRFRLINVAPAGQLVAMIYRDEELIPIRLWAKDGADLPAQQQVEVDVLPRMGVGETADFLWTPTEPGVYRLLIGPPGNPERGFNQMWTVTRADGEGAAGPGVSH